MADEIAASKSSVGRMLILARAAAIVVSIEASHRPDCQEPGRWDAGAAEAALGPVEELAASDKMRELAA